MKKNLKFVNQFNQIGMSRLTFKRSSETKKEEKMFSKLKSILIVIVALFAVCAMAGSAMAAINTAVDDGSAISLSDSLSVTVTSSALGLIKAVYDSAGTCIASSDSHVDCGTTDTVSVPTGTRLTFVIYVDNTSGVEATDVRFKDDIDDAAADYFEYQTTTYGASHGIAFGTAATGATKGAIYTAATGGTGLTNALDGATANEYAGIDQSGSPDVLTVGGTDIDTSNAQVDIAASTVFAITFDVIKRD